MQVNKLYGSLKGRIHYAGLHSDLKAIARLPNVLGHGMMSATMFWPVTTIRSFFLVVVGGATSAAPANTMH